MRGLLVIYRSQTKDEQADHSTKWCNRVGFTAYDAKVLSPLAQHLERCGWLSPRQMGVVFRKMPHYARQLVDIARAKQKVGST